MSETKSTKTAAAASKTTAKKAAAKKTAAKKKVSKKTVAKKAAAKKAAAKSSATTEATTPATPKTKKKAAAAATKKTASVKSTPKATKKTASTTPKASKAPAAAADTTPTAAARPASPKPSTKESMSQASSTAANDSPVSEESAPRSSHYMDKDQLAYFSKRLAEWKQQLMEEVDRTVGHMKDDATNFPDPNDRATQEEEFSLELRTRDRERKLIKKINEAQRRIEDEEYGYCESCGIEIGVARLEARLTAELCIDCKTLEEIRERQTA